MKKIYISGNYIIAEQSGLINEYAMGKSVYTKRDGAFRILEQLDKGELRISVADAVNWYDESGTTPFTESTLEAFFRANTGFNIASGGNGASSASVLYMELNRSQDLNVITPVIGQVVYVQNMDISFRYNGTEWKQCGETAIYRGGLISGTLYVNELKVG